MLFQILTFVTPGVLHDVLSVKALAQTDKDISKVDAALILKLMPSAIADELTRKQLAEKALGSDVKELVGKIWEALQPLVEVGQGDLRQGVEFVILMMKRNQTDQQTIANMLLSSPELFKEDALAMLREIAQGKTTIPPEETLSQ